MAEILERRLQCDMREAVQEKLDDGFTIVSREGGLRLADNLFGGIVQFVQEESSVVMYYV